MASKLVEELRRGSKFIYFVVEESAASSIRNLMDRAASRIERYEAALQDIADGASDARGIAAAALREASPSA